MNTNCRLINGRAVCPPVQFITPRIWDQESDEYTIPHRSTSTSITIDSERTRVLTQPLVTTLSRDQYSIIGSGPPPPARVDSKEAYETLHPSEDEEQRIGNYSKRTCLGQSRWC
uniref:Uncharacterized protein n=1 Tax=Magallana gigas TaxID=29159 RepID=A0A8W8ML42_MAGGI